MLQPMAVGLVRVKGEGRQIERRHLRVVVGAFAHVEGYALLEVFEVAGWAVRDEANLASLVRLATRTNAQALLVADDVPVQVVALAVKETGLRRVSVPMVQRYPRTAGGRG